MSEGDTRVTVRALLKQEKYLKPFQEVMGDKAPQFVASVMQISNSGLLAEADPRTVIASAYTGACLDLPIDKNLGFAHIVPYAKKAQFQIGYKGYIQLALRSGQYQTLNDFKVNRAAFISYDYRSGELKLDDAKLDEYDEDIVGYAFYFKLISGFEKMVYWPKEKVEAHAKRYSQAYRAGKKDSPWFTQFDAMALKTLISNTLRKYGILSVQMQLAMKFDQAVRSDIGSEEPEYVDGNNDPIPDASGEDSGDNYGWSKETGKNTAEKVKDKLNKIVDGEAEELPLD